MSEPVQSTVEDSAAATEVVSVEFPTARALVRLRFALEHAVALGRDPSEAGTQIAIIALDGVVEYALWLVARFKGVEFGKPFPARHELLKKVQSKLGEDWNLLGADAVDQLHRARNDAQHAAVLFDVSQVPDWSSATVAFVDSLVRSAFSNSLFDVALADAIRDPRLADALRRAQSHLEEAQPDPEAAFVLVGAAFDEARERWREQQVHAYGQPLVEVKASSFDTSTTKDEMLADFLEVVPFANDLGEYSWFVSACRQKASGWVPEAEHSRRALVFVSGWIVRWEVFVRGYPQEHWDHYWENLVPPTSGDGTKTEIRGVEIVLTTEFPGHPARCRLLFDLANVPDQARGPWGTWLIQALPKAAQELGQDIRFSHTQLDRRGRLLLICQLGYDADAVASVVRRGIELADESYSDWIQHEDRTEKQRTRIQEEFAAVIDAARTGRQLFKSVEVKERAADGKLVVWLGLNFGGSKFEELNLCTGIFRDLKTPFLPTDVFEDHLLFEAFELTDENEALLQNAVRRCEEIVLERRAFYQQRIQGVHEFATRLHELFPRA